MKKEKQNQKDSSLRQRAETKLEIAGHSGMLPEDMPDIVHELQVHQIELKMQNDELRRIQGELERERDRYSHLYNFSPVGYFTVSEKGIIEEVNLTGAAMTGIERRALIGMHFSLLVFKDDQDIFYKHRKSLIETESPGAFELRFVKKNGHEYYVLLECVVIKNMRTGLRQIRVAVSDITELKHAEDALRESEEKYRNLYETMAQGVVYQDVNGRITGANPAAERLLGLMMDDMLGMTSVDPGWRAIHEDGSDFPGETHPSMVALRTGKEVLNVVMGVFNPKINGYVWLNIDAIPQFKPGEKKPYQVYTTFEDVTERRKMKEDLYMARNLESMGVLAGGIAHDFNNILTAVIGNVSLAKMQAKHEGELYDLLNEAEVAAIRAQGLTRQLLTFAKGGSPVKETASIKEILRESCLFLLRGSKACCEFSIADDVLPAEIDTGQISQVISNIVINSIQAMPEGGVIKVSADNHAIEDGQGLPVKPGRYIKISIKDQGVGIAEKHLLKIFDPYFTTKHKGSGLGLAVAYSIIRKHNGHITVESRLGAGTTFHIYLPASDKTVPEKAEVKLIKGKGKILVMDDEEPLREVLGKMLETLGYETEFAKDGAEAVEMYKNALESEKPYDAVIMDLTIPGGMGGKDAIEKLLEIDPEAKAIVSSGYYDDPVLSNFQEYGFKGILPKPFRHLSLGKTLHEVLQDKK
jgi:two-component system, cell cycle sensor histidine kinase and response regulator CckA